jgi:hypothetical protein
MERYRGYPRKGGARSKKVTRFQIAGFLVFVSIIVLFVGFLVYGFSNSGYEVDKKTFCPVVSGKLKPAGQTVILIDTSDSLSNNQKDALRIYVRRIVDTLPAGELVNIYIMDEETFRGRKPVLEICRPRDGSDASAINENEKLMRRRFNERFERPIEDAIDRISLQKGNANSPILEMIQIVGLSGFQKWNVDGSRHLFIFSDMIHNTDQFSLYRSANFEFSAFRNSNYWSEIITDLSGVDVTIYQFINRPELQKQGLLTFWRRYFSSIKGQVVEVIPIGK